MDRQLAQVTISTSFGENFFNAPTSIGGFLSGLIPQIFILAMIVVIIYLIWGSYRYLMSGGDPKAVAGAKQQLTWAVLGLIIMILSYMIFQLINSLVFNVYA